MPYRNYSGIENAIACRHVVEHASGFKVPSDLCQSEQSYCPKQASKQARHAHIEMLTDTYGSSLACVCRTTAEPIDPAQLETQLPEGEAESEDEPELPPIDMWLCRT